MKKTNMTRIVYIITLILFIIPVVYLFGSVIIAFIQQPDDCSFASLFIVMGVVFSIFAGAALLNLLFEKMYCKTETKIFALFSSVIDLAFLSGAILISTLLLADGTPALIKAIFVAFGAAYGACFLIHVVKFVKREGERV